MTYVITEKYQNLGYGDLVAIGEDMYLVCRDHAYDEIVLLDIGTSVIRRVGTGSLKEVEEDIDDIISKSIDLILQKRN